MLCNLYQGGTKRHKSRIPDAAEVKQRDAQRTQESTLGEPTEHGLWRQVREIKRAPRHESWQTAVNACCWKLLDGKYP